MKYSHLIIIAALISCQWAAADSRGTDPVAPVFISAMIIDDGMTTESWRGGEDGEDAGLEQVELYYISDGRVESVIVPHANLSPYFVYRGPPTLYFYTRPPPLPGEDRPFPPVAATVTIAEGSGELVLIFITENFAAREFRVIPIATGGDIFPANRLRLINLSPTAVVYRLDEYQGALSPGAQEVVELLPQQGYQDFQIARRTDDGGHWRLEYNRHLQVRDGMRMTCLILPRPGRIVGQPVMVRMIRENYSQRLNRLKRHTDYSEE